MNLVGFDVVMIGMDWGIFYFCVFLIGGNGIVFDMIFIFLGIMYVED